ncbi:MAG TPA: histidine phosphatase family protein [Nocardioides sp.]|nr:histidine phosphatase family protein [Nocardioides sp.]
MGLVLLVRHGQASFGAEDYDVLSETGVEQSRMLGRALADQGLAPTAVVHGAMQRQRDTATAIVDGGGWSASPILNDGWDEFDHVGVIARYVEASGVGEPSDRREVQQVFENATARWTGGKHDDEYEEVWSAFVARVVAALDRACAQDGITVVSSSGGPIAAAFAGLVDPSATPAGLPRLWRVFNTVIVNASVTRVLQGSTGRRLLTFNEHGHLPRELVTYR